MDPDCSLDTIEELLDTGDMDEDNKKSDVAEKRPRDSKGHFIAAVKKQVNVSQGHDDDKLIDLKVNNPLQKITEILEDIKRQKAFQFTLKGSLGIMGVVLSLSLLGIFGTTHMLCDKGTQTQLGIIKVLQATEEEEPLALWGKFKKTVAYFQNLYSDSPMPDDKPQPRIILFTANKTAIQILGIKETHLADFINKPVFATGKYDSCTQKLQVTKPQNIELSN